MLHLHQPFLTSRGRGVAGSGLFPRSLGGSGEGSSNQVAILWQKGWSRS